MTESFNKHKLNIERRLATYGVVARLFEPEATKNPEDLPLGH